MAIIFICILTSHDISTQLNYSILGRRLLEWMKEHIQKPVQDTAGSIKKPLRDTAWFEIRAMTMRGRTRYPSVTEAPHKTHSLRMDGEETLGFYENRISVGSVCCSAPVWHADATWPTLNQHWLNVLRLLGFSWWATWCLLHIFSSQTRDVEPMLGWCWPSVADAGPTSTQHWLNASCRMTLHLGEATRTKADTCHNPEAEDITNLPRCSTSKRRQSPPNSQPKYPANWLTEIPTTSLENSATYHKKTAEKTPERWGSISYLTNQRGKKWSVRPNSSPGGLRLSTLALGHGGSPQYWIITSERGRNILFLRNLVMTF